MLAEIFNSSYWQTGLWICRRVDLKHIRETKNAPLRSFLPPVWRRRYALNSPLRNAPWVVRWFKQSVWPLNSPWGGLRWTGLKSTHLVKQTAYYGELIWKNAKMFNSTLLNSPVCLRGQHRVMENAMAIFISAIFLDVWIRPFRGISNSTLAQRGEKGC